MSAKGPVVLGAGSSGEHFVGALRRLDPEVEIAVVECGLAGGECSAPRRASGPSATRPASRS